MLVSSEKLPSLAVLTQGGLRFDIERRSINGTTSVLTLNLKSQQELTTRPMCLSTDQEAGTATEAFRQGEVREGVQSCNFRRIQNSSIRESVQ
jgi:hypothetical protein